MDIHGECRLSSYMLDILRITGPLTKNQIEQFKDLSEIQETRQRIMDIKRNGREVFLQNSNNNRHKLALRSPRRFENNTERFENNTERFENSTETETDGDKLLKATAILKELLPKYFSRQYGNMKDTETQTENNTEKTVDMNKLKTLMEFAVEKIPDSSISNVKCFLDCCMGHLVNKSDEAMSFYCNKYTRDNNDLTNGRKNELLKNNTDIEEIWDSHRNSKYMIDDDYFETRMQSIINATIDACNKRAKSLGCKPSKDKIIVDYLNTRNRIAGEKKYNQSKVSADVSDSVDISNQKYTFAHEMERHGISLETTDNNNENMILNVMRTSRTVSPPATFEYYSSEDDLRTANVSQSTTTTMSYGDKSSDREIFIEKSQTNKPFMIMKQNRRRDEEHIGIKPNESKSHPSTFSYYLPESAVPFNWARNCPDPCDDVVDDEYYREELVVPKLDLMFTRLEDVPISINDTDSSLWSESQSFDRSFQMNLRSKNQDTDITGKTKEEESFNLSARPNVTNDPSVVPDFDIDESIEKITECEVKPIINRTERIGYDSNTELREKRKRILESANTRILHEEKELDSNSVDVSSKTSNQEENAFETFDLEILSPNTKTDMKRRILKSAKWVLAAVTYMEMKKELEDCKSLFQIENLNNDVVTRDINSYENISSTLTKSHPSNDQFGSRRLYESDKSSNSSQSRGRECSFEKFDKPTEQVFISSPSSLVHVSVSGSALQNKADNSAYNGQIRTELEESTDGNELTMQSIEPQGRKSLFEHTNEDIKDNQPHVSFSSESLSSDIIPNIISSVVETLQRDHAHRMSDLPDDLSSCSWKIPTIPPESPHYGLNTLCDTTTINPEFRADDHMVTDPMTTEKLSDVKDTSINNEDTLIQKTQKSLKRNESKKQNIVNHNYEIETLLYSDHKELPVHLKNDLLQNNPNDQQHCYSAEVKSVPECLRTPLSTSDCPSVIQSIDTTEIRTISECSSTPSCRSDWASTESDFSKEVCQTGLFEYSEKKNRTYDGVSVCKEEDCVNNNRRNQNVDAFITTMQIEEISNICSWNSSHSGDTGPVDFVVSAANSDTKSAAHSETKSAANSETNLAANSETKSAANSETNSPANIETKSAANSHTTSAANSETKSAANSATNSAANSDTKSDAHSETKSGANSETKPAVNSETKSAANSETKSPANSDTKSAANSDTTSAANSETKSAANSETNSAANSDTKSDAHSETKSGANSETKPAVNSETKSAANSETKSAANSETTSAANSETKSAANSETKPAANSEKKSAANSETKSAANSDTKSAASSDTKPAANSDTKSATNSETKSAANCETKLAANSDTKSAANSETKPAAKSETKSASSSDTKSAANSDTKSATNSETKSAANCETKLSANSDTKSAANSATKPAAKSETKSAANSETKSAANSETKSAANSETKSAANCETKSAANSDTKPAANSDTKSAANSDTKSAANSDTKSAANSDTKSAANSDTKMKNRHIDNEVFTVDEILNTKSFLSCLNKENEIHLDNDLVENIGPVVSKIKENTVNFDEASIKSNCSWDSDGSERQNLLNNDEASVTSCCSWDSNSEFDKDDSINMIASKHMQSLLESDSTKLQIHGNKELEQLQETKNIIADIKHIDQSTVQIPKVDTLVGNESKTQLSNKDTDCNNESIESPGYWQHREYERDCFQQKSTQSETKSKGKSEIPVDDEDVFLSKKRLSTLHEVLSNRHLNEELNRNKLDNTEFGFEDSENLEGVIKTVGRNVLYRGALVIDDGGGDTTDDCSVIDMPKSELERWQESKNQSLQKCDEDQNIATEQIQTCLFQRMIPDHKNNQNDKIISKSKMQALLPLRGTPMLNQTQKMSNDITSMDYVYNSPNQMPSFQPLEKTLIGKPLKRQGMLAPLKPIQETIKQEKVKSPKRKKTTESNVKKSKTKKKANKIKAQPVHQTKDVHENSSTDTFSMPSFELAEDFHLAINTQRDLRSNIQMDDDFIQNSPDSSESSCKRNFRDYMDKRKMDDDFAINSYESSDSEISERNVNYNCNGDPTTGINVVVSQKRCRQKKAPLKSVIGRPPVCNNTFSIKSVNNTWTPDYRIWDSHHMVDGSVWSTFDYIGETKI
ncbi:serine-rich adhesin for platelets-like [Mytilus trossulus]|uniref:serine-rich adhesin for platelets-like n=1 Tax=Mytilus trossulus TaxID=6551 RepID=UPI0030068839